MILAPPFTFRLDDGFTPVSLGNLACELSVEDLDRRLAVFALPGGAPLASWLLARLERLSGGLGLAPDGEDEVEDALWILDFVVEEAGQPVAKVQLQAGAIGAGLLGVARAPDDAARLVDALVAALTAAPDEVAPCRTRVVCPRTGAAAVYGFDGTRYLR